MVAVFIPGLKLTPSAAVPDHQSQAVFPGLIQDVSAIADGAFRLMTMFDSISRPARSPIMITRHGERAGVAVETAMPGSSTDGASLENSERASRPLCWRYMPA